MPLEDLTGPDKFLDALNKDWPLDDDDKPEGDNHIRGVKNVLVNTFGSQSSYVDLDQVVMWNTPAASQAKETGSLPSAVGTTAQRPDSPSDWDHRYNTDVETEGVACEHYAGGSWGRIVAQLNLRNLFQQDVHLDVGDPADAGSFRYLMYSDDGTFARRMAGIGFPLNRDFDDASGGDCDLDIFHMADGDYKRALGATLADGLYSWYADLTLDQNGTPVKVLKENGGTELAPKIGWAHGIWAHGLGYVPRLFRIVMECAITEHGYAVGDEVDPQSLTLTLDTQNNARTSGATISADATNIVFRPGSISPWIAHKTTGAIEQITPANWLVYPVVWG